MLEIESIKDLNGYVFQNFSFEVLDSKVIIKNLKENILIELGYEKNNIIRVIDNIYRLTELKVLLNSLEEREILPFIEDKGFEKVLWSPIGKAMSDFNMIESGDRVAVGVSGGKDSLTVLNALVRIKKISKVNFDIIPIHIHPEEEGGKFQDIVRYCEKLGLTLQVIKTSIGESILENKELKNPCFMCARVRRGLLYKEMISQKIDKLALGHHKDDIVETFLLNIFYQGNIGVMKPAYDSKEYKVKIIRPLAYVEEKDIIRYSKKLNMPILINECPYETSYNSKRLRVKNMIKDLAKDSPNIRSVIFNSMRELFKK